MGLHVHHYGDPAGDPLVCLHGVGGHGGRFRGLARMLSDRRVVAPDLRGHGRSTYDPPWSTEQHVEDLLQATASWDEPADWLGFSYGGRIAAAITAQAPPRVRRLVLLDPVLGLRPDIAGRQAEAELAAVTFANAEAAVDATLGDGTLFTTPREAVEEDVSTHYVVRKDGRLEARVCRPMAVTAWSEMARRPPRRTGTPTLLITGARSWIPVNVPRLGPTRHIVMPGGHSVLWDDLPQTAAAVADFLCAV